MMSKIRVLHCIETIASGGVEQTLLTIIRGLDSLRFQHKIICTWKGGAVAEALEKEGVELISIGSFKHPFEWKKHQEVLKVIRGFKPHIIHGAVFEGMTMASVGGFLGNVPVTILEETSDPQNRSVKANFLLKLFSIRADAFQAISNDVGNYLKMKTGVKSKSIQVISNGVLTPKISSAVERDKLKNKLCIKDSEFVVGFVGRLYNNHKRFTDLLKAIKLVNLSYLKLLVIGDGIDKQLLLKEIELLRISENLVHVGYQSDPHPFYDIMDVLCVPSSREGFGLVAAEAMMHGLPVIATKVGGLKDVILDKETGFLVSPFSPQEIADKIQILIKNPGIGKKMGQKGKIRAMDNYSADRYSKDVEHLYLELLKAKGINN
ncbi:glycosyltransferase [uncultured Cyclobacterium sp.]|uniref:glycosyltransferase n=1 Tax=uncultured Cyclobacterium sp. TaxID=453820 RepID=UPI0030EBD6A6|tara:strand:- start:23821 stop:24951 length:1131 start_codon:yes stop_codon:yes gene_type:complete